MARASAVGLAGFWGAYVMLTDAQTGVLKGLTGKRAAIVGIGVTNVPLIRFLAGHGVRVTACDLKQEDSLASELRSLAGLDVQYLLGPGYLDALPGFDVVYLSPGVNPGQPEIEAARRAGVAISSEIDLVLRLSAAPTVGITGSSGKTTTTTLTGLILREDARRHHPARQVLVGGNIGAPVIERVLTCGPDDLIVLELSSFQLKLLEVSPRVAAVLNVTPNHLDVHPSMDDYVWSKENIVRYQSDDDWAVFGADNDVTQLMAERAPGQIMFFSASRPVPRGAFLDGDRLVMRWSAGSGPCGSGGLGAGDIVVAHRSDLKIPGMHNVQNALAAIVVCAAAGADPEAMRDAIAAFSGVEHRLEPAGEVGGVIFINDSIATTPSRTIAALEAMERPIVLIAGGYDKHLPFDEMARLALGKVHTAALVGVTADKIEQAFEEAADRAAVRPPAIIRADTFREAVEAARLASRPGDAVLLSPACASYGLFRNFEERGRTFKQLVSEFAAEAGEVCE
jgi:UDP-N-acetylmuramoylalanine--D-glutamate ligase